ncbi:S8/S53 family peptidase [Nubsella zeaxanthinifaciens]|uniref:S8/S53 family peptidase n=1 Tax=Nubsella zeaxanthinifaciens TaxID=392412 RepID=UPI000DE20631|nr:S8/S53 family peptidase [Nubsella zeaxanthinifaciens]
MCKSRHHFSVLLLALLSLAIRGSVFAQANKLNQTNTSFLKENAVALYDNEQKRVSKAIAMAAEKGWEVFGTTKDGSTFILYGVDGFGLPLYKYTENNKVAAATINTNKLYAGGGLGLSLNGSTLPNDKIAIWDGGAVLTTHVEFQTNRVEVKDGTTATSTHSTHVAGTIMAEGKYENARGMAYGLPKLLSFDFNNDNSEMSTYAANLLISNHSYGTIAGWYENTGTNPSRWEFRGQFGANEDYKFGYYDSDAKEWDRICYNAPFYLPVKSGGNYRNSNGPAVGELYYRYNASGTMINAGARPAGISNNDGYDILGTYAVAKNIMTVAAVNPLPYGTVTPNDITISSFSAWGPTDDGRIKPDIAADGVNVTSTSSAGNGAYTTLSGTSMAAPSVSGSLALLQELYFQKNNSFMRAATLKALALGTASEAGAFPGPDYIFGWGLMNTASAAKAILNKGGKSLINEKSLTQGGTETFTVTASGDGPLIATICWTDPEIDIIPIANALNNRTLRLVNDLDMRCISGTNSYLPWILDPNNPAAAATTGDNFRDNVEQIYIADVVPGQSYTFTISHKGTLQRGSQAFSVVVTGVGGKPYCASAPSSAADSKITSFSLSDVNYTATAGCTTLSDFSNRTVSLEIAKTYPLTISLGTCGNNFNKAAKVYIDWNADGDFDDANELTATTNIISGNGNYTTNITVPNNVSVNTFTLLRIVLAETNDISTINACGSYAKGETLTYRVKLINSSTDVGISNIIQPVNNCANIQQTVKVMVRNYGSQAVANVPVTVSVYDGTNLISTLSGTYTGTLQPAEEREFLLPGSFIAQAGKTYNINAKTTLSEDVIAANNEFNASQQIALATTLSNANAIYCNNSNQYQLSAASDGVVYWYKSATDVNPFAYGNNLSTANAPTGGKYYASVNDYSSALGPKDKYDTRLGTGTYLQTTGAVNVTVLAPMLLESAKLYIGHAGTIRFYVQNSVGVEVSSTTLQVTATRSTPVLGTATNDLTDQGQVYTLNLKFPEAGNYTIYTAYENDATIFRNNALPSSIYPISSALGIFNIVGNNATTPGSFYYYFYDMKIKALGCASAARIEVPFANAGITQIGDELVSNFSNNNQWYLNGEIITGATSQRYKPLKAGRYAVQTNILSGCTVVSNELLYLPKDKGESSLKLQVFPLPTTDRLTVAFEITEEKNVQLTLFNIVGQKVLESKKDAQKGVIIENLDVSRLPSGTYVLKIKVGDDTYTKKIMVL